MQEDTPIPDHKDRLDRADDVGQRLYGEKKWRGILGTLKSLDEDFASLIQEVPYGTVYPRDALSLPQREIIAITALTLLNLKPQLKSHIIAAMNLGMSREEIVEIFIHLSMFIGFPVAMEGLKVARDVFSHYDNKD